MFHSLKNAFLYSLSGIKYLLKERAFQQELLLGFIILVAEFLFPCSSLMRIYIFSSFIFVLICEGINSAIESVIDRIGTEKHILSKKAKDIGSAVVFFSLVNLFIIWILSHAQ
ncbi:MAG: diacylglycerol kinase [Holosporaceae bacterium]|jgi:diacylglycerol kinase (ATP)|nr:diacylglycerol kinase [Holosporaceae bacterium]